MAAFNLEFEIALAATKNKFIDRPHIRRLMSKDKREAMAKVGSYIRTTAKRSLRTPPQKKPLKQLKSKQRRNRKRKAGGPPYTHPPQRVLKRSIFFTYDEKSQSVVAGPIKLPGAKKTTGIPVSGKKRTVPETMEYGGRVKLVSSYDYTVSRWRKKAKYKTTTVKYPAFPYMRPALAKATQAGPMKQHLKLLRRR